jgi:HPt (histidine-containing phosphotransfer) domain-containing protein
MLDRTTIDQLIADIGKDVFLRLSLQFLEETSNRLLALVAARQREAWPELARHAHSLKSTAQSFGLIETGILARELQVAADHLETIRIDAVLPRLQSVTAAECSDFEGLRVELASHGDR